MIEIFSHRTSILDLRAASRKFLPTLHQLFHASCSLRLKHSAQSCGIPPQEYRAVKEYALAAASQEANRFQAFQEIRFQLRRVELSLCEKRADFIDMRTKYLAGKIRSVCLALRIIIFIEIKGKLSHDFLHMQNGHQFIWN